MECSRKHLSLIAVQPNWAGEIKLNAAENKQARQPTPRCPGEAEKIPRRPQQFVQKYKLEHLRRRRRVVGNTVRIYGPALGSLPG